MCLYVSMCLYVMRAIDMLSIIVLPNVHWRIKNVYER